jgi:AraC family transcriptional regulator
MAEAPVNNTSSKYLREEYRARINRVIDYIEANLSQDLSLETLADIACFSRFHFHRLFGAMVGETLNHYIQRLRVEKAASKLIHNPKKSITEIALECGFSSSATFARAFKEWFDMSASDWRSGGHLQDRKIRKMDSNQHQIISNTGKDFDVSSRYIQGTTITQIWRVKMKGNSQLKTDVEVKEMPELHVAYVRHIGPYAGDSELFGRLFGKLMMWAGPRGLLQDPNLKTLSVYYDNPDITEEENLRVDVCVTVPEDTPIDGEIGKMTVPGGKYAVAHFEIDVDQYSDAWNAVYGGWLPESGYQPADGPCYELCLNNPEEHPEKKHIVDIWVPVKPL